MGHSSGPGNTAKWIFWIGNNSISFISTQIGWVGLGASNFELGQWYHAAIRKSSNELSAFVNGSQIGSTTIDFSIPDPNASFIIGAAEFDRPNRLFDGQIDDVRLYNHALLDSEIGQLSSVPIPGTFFILLVGLFSILGLKKRMNK